MISQPIIHRIIPLYDMPSVFKDECSSKNQFQNLVKQKSHMNVALIVIIFNPIYLNLETSM